MGLFYSHTRPGKGIDPNAPQQKSVPRFFSIFFRKFWHSVRVNLLYTAALIPTYIVVFLLSGFVTSAFFLIPGVGALLQQYETAGAWFDILIRLLTTNLFVVLWGMGPATAGITYIMRNFAREEHAWVWSDFKDAVKNNWKQALGVFVIDCIIFTLCMVALIVYSQMGGFAGALRYVMVMILLVYTMMHFYIYPIMVTFELKLKDIYRNALLFACGKLPSNLLILALQILIHVGTVFFIIASGGMYTVFLIILFFLLQMMILWSFSALLTNFHVYPKMKKYMLDAAENKTE
ncbi:MAG: YesL family protein [Clostridia bacterium]|nr:YesL family protein [Clostridia bacterium]